MQSSCIIEQNRTEQNRTEQNSLLSLFVFQSTIMQKPQKKL